MFAMTQTPAISFKSSFGDARPFVAGRPISRPMRTSTVPLARGPSLKNKNNIAKVPSCGKESVFITALVKKLVRNAGTVADFVYEESSSSVAHNGSC